MKGFWQNLSQLAQGQLFHGGYLSQQAVRRLSAPRGKNLRDNGTRRKAMPWPRLAIPH